MRLLFVHDRFGAMAGAEVNVFSTATALKRHGYTLGLLHGEPTGIATDQWTDLFSERFQLPRELTYTATEAAVQHFKPDAFYVHKMSELGVLQALLDSQLPVVRMVHDHDLYCLRSYKYFPLTRTICTRAAGWFCVIPCGAVVERKRDGRWLFRWRSYRDKIAELRLNRQFNCMIVASQQMKSELLRNGFDPSRIQIHAPVPSEAASSITSSFDERNRIVYAGQIIRGKGVDVLMEILARVTAPYECIVMGEGSHRARCQNLAMKLGISDKVRFTGYLPPEQLSHYYKSASLAVVSSVWPEPFGAVGLEAMHFGLPVVAFDCGGIREWLIDGRNGFLVPWMNRDAFANRISQLLLNKSMARDMGSWGRHFARDKFNFVRYVSGLEGLFENLVTAPKTQNA
jgi:glycosyltransferase involved in cell wall biosynthesis